MPEPISTLSLTQLIDSGGTYPQPGDGPATNVMAMLRTLASPPGDYGAPTCDGQLQQIAMHQAMFSLLGTTYGGDGRTTFALPNLRGRVAIGGGPGQGAPAPG